MNIITFSGKIILYCTFILGLFSIMYIDIYEHESAHRVIGSHYGCYEDKIEITLEHGYWECLKYHERDEWMVRDELLLQNMNEIVRYNSKGIFYGIIFFIIIFIYYKETGEKNGKNNK